MIEAGPGDGLAILVNANAKRGGRRIAAQLARRLTGARVHLTKSPTEIDDWLRSLPTQPRCVLAAGGDGTAIGLTNALARVAGDQPLWPMGALPLGTGNAWAHATGSRKLAWCVEQLARARGPLPFRTFGLVDVGGTLCHFAGSGWDSEILEDFRAQLAAAKGPSARVARTATGYLTAMLTRTVPKQLLYGRPNVIVENLGEEVYTISADEKLVRMHGVGYGTILYDGPASVAGASTCPEFGYRFRAYPFAERLPGFLNARVYDEHVLRAVASIPSLWRGDHPMRGVHDWFTRAVRMTFSRPVALQVGGDACGLRQTVEYRSSAHRLEMLDWRRLG